MTRFWVVAFVFLGATLLRAEDISVDAKLMPQQIALGQSAKLQITVNGGQKVEKIDIPPVQDLQIDHVSEMSNFQFVNGAVSSSVSHIYTVVPTSTGSFKIPPINVVVKGNAYKTPPFTLQVLNTPAPTTPSTPSPSQALANQPSQGNADANAKIAFLTLEIPKKEIYVGERVPIEIKAYFLPGQQTSLASLPVLTSDAFTFAGVTEKYQQSDAIVQGQNYIVLTWNSSMDAIKEGEYSIDGRLECVVAMRRQPLMQRPRGFFDDFFGMMEQRPLTLRLPPEKIKILPLPEHGKPENFSGAVGQFEIRSLAQPTKLASGDPVTLTVTVAGKGNFERLTAPKLASEDGFKIYTPTSKFEPSSIGGFEGKKIFEQAMIPQKTGNVSLPSVELSYFDPEAKQYKTASTHPIPLQIEASSVPVPAGSTAVKTVNLSAPVQNVSQNNNELAPNKIEIGTLCSDAQPLMLKRWFFALEFTFFAALVGLFIGSVRKERRLKDPRYLQGAAASKAIRTQIEIMESAEKRNDAAAFFSAARKALQHRLAEIWSLKPDVITAAEIGSRLPDAQRLREIFEISDSVAYADGAAHTYQLAEWKKVVLEELKSL